MPAVHGIDIPVILAPMAGVTDAPMRRLARRFGADFCYGEMTAADRDDARRAKFQRRLHVQDEARPWIVQLAGAEPDVLAQAAIDHVAMGANIIDINMGCPAKKVRKKACGSALMGEPGLVREIFSEVRRAVAVPLTVKMRTGLHRDAKNAIELAQLAESAGLDAVAIHGRTRADMYKGDAEFETIREVRQAIGIPVIANGDIRSAGDALRVLDQTGAAGIMIGRAALGRPWLFAQVRAAIDGRRVPEPPPPEEMLSWVQEHATAVDAHYGADLGLRVFRKHLAGWLEQMAVGSECRKAILRADTREHSFHLLERALPA